MGSRTNPEKLLRRNLRATPKIGEQLAKIVDTIYFAEVIDIDDPIKSNRIKVKLFGENIKVFGNKHWCIDANSPFIRITPKVGELVLVFMRNPWSESSIRFWMGPIMTGINTDEEFIGETLSTLSVLDKERVDSGDLLVDKDSVAIVGRQKNSVILNYDKSILISSDITKNNNETPTIEFDDEENTMIHMAKDILLSSPSNANDSYSTVYGERLVELLKWMIKIMKTHQHPPNNIPVNTFFVDADNWVDKMETYLLNDHVKTK